jgi:LDH2 family malate/lactate/ureidoglycolate dehydrogenase
LRRWAGRGKASDDGRHYGSAARFGRSAVVRAIRESQRLPDFDRIWLPGEQSHTKRIERLVLGVPIPSTLRKNLDELAREL